MYYDGSFTGVSCFVFSGNKLKGKKESYVTNMTINNRRVEVAVLSFVEVVVLRYVMMYIMLWVTLIVVLYLERS